VIECPGCGFPTEVDETRSIKGGLRRRRRCTSPTCGEKMTTLEFLIRSEGERVRRVNVEFVMVPRDDLEQLASLVGGMLSRNQKP
jgi:hypothetical protein